MSKTTGGCFCGQVRFEFEGEEIPVADCHCSMCRRTSGAPYVTWLVVREENFRYTQGEPKVLNSSEDGTRFFCAECGTPLACTNTAHPGIVDVTLGSLDNPEDFPPTFSIHEDTKLPFL
jgi:hypothetical protein